MFISDPGYKLCGVDKEQIDSRYVGLLCGLLFDDWTYLDMCESGDCHTSVARMVWPELKWTGDLKRDRLIAEEPFHNETRRQSCKILGHGTNIMGTSQTLAIETGIPKHEIEIFQERYFTAIPAIPKLHRWIAWKIEKDQFLTNIFNRRRDTNLGGLRMWLHMGSRIQLLTQEHDAWYFQFREDDNEEEIVAEAQKHMKVEIPISNTRVFSVPTEAKTGWNKGLRWQIDKNGNKNEVNPRGLDKPGAKR
jgi:hypothetical protein